MIGDFSRLRVHTYMFIHARDVDNSIQVLTVGRIPLMFKHLEDNGTIVRKKMCLSALKNFDKFLLI